MGEARGGRSERWERSGDGSAVFNRGRSRSTPRDETCIGRPAVFLNEPAAARLSMRLRGWLGPGATCRPRRVPRRVPARAYRAAHAARHARGARRRLSRPPSSSSPRPRLLAPRLPARLAPRARRRVLPGIPRAPRRARSPAASHASAIRPCLLYTSPSPRDATLSRMPSSA